MPVDFRVESVNNDIIRSLHLDSSSHSDGKTSPANKVAGINNSTMEQIDQPATTATPSHAIIHLRYSSSVADAARDHESHY